jgi:azurin
MLAAMLISAPSLANNCEITVVSNDMMQFDKKSITVDKSCKEFKVTLTHSGKLPKTAMGHNWVLTKASDARGVAADGMGAGIDNSYVKKGDSRVIALTKVIGGGESTSVTFPVSKLAAGEQYKFFCSFPGHIGIMIGDLTLG